MNVDLLDAVKRAWRELGVGGILLVCVLAIAFMGVSLVSLVFAALALAIAYEEGWFKVPKRRDD